MADTVDTAPSAVSTATAAPPPSPGESDDDIIADLAGQAQNAKDKTRVGDDSDEDEPATASDSDEDDDTEASDEDGDDDEDTEPETPKGKKAKKGGKALEAARAALEDGDIEKALKLAFDKDPEFFKIDTGKWTAFRAAQRREMTALRSAQAQHQQKEQAFKQEVQSTIQELKPAAQIIQLAKQFQATEDWSLVIRLAESVTGKDWDTINKNCLRGVKRSPEALRIQRELDALKQQLSQKEQAQQQQQAQLTEQQVYAQDLGHIREETKSHKVRHIPGFERRVYNVLLKTRDPNLGLTMTVKEAASRVLKGEKRRIEKVQAALGKKAKAEVEAPTVKKATGNKPVLRRDSTSDGTVRDEDESTEDIIQDILRQQSNQRLASKSNGKVRRAS